MAARRQRGVGHRGNELAEALGTNRIPALNAQGQPCLKQRRFGAFEHVAPTAIGANSTILPGSIIEKGCVIAAGSVVKGTCKTNRLYAGVPAKEIRQLD